ncbi:hypothetical protein GIB67_006279 [Kingdonia uniflora]|uniref:Myb-like domain-containing protein n=1 Tax=Kingdonia uniflora TaxID=39325 RepID=A0A7J7P598_9MAGN|nr:hypothetical protein GIB67_006279 [Kingdonia uniflora]
MSEPPTTSTIQYHHYQHHQYQSPAPLLITPITTTPPTLFTQDTTTLRDYHKGNWKLEETLTLIKAKKLEEQRKKTSKTSTFSSSTSSPTSSSSSSRRAKLSWKRIEDYCWTHNCCRSDTQCNDKWDNLIRDYKKVRNNLDHHTCPSRCKEEDEDVNDNVQQQQQHQVVVESYWKMEKKERKENGLPTNLDFEVFYALDEILQTKYSSHSHNNKTVTTPLALPSTLAETPPPLPAVSVAFIRQAPPQTLPLPSPPLQTVSDSSDTSEPDRSERLESDTKRRKMESRSDSVLLAETLQVCEEHRERRHRDIMAIEDRRVKIEETRNEANEKGFTKLIAAVNNLSGVIHALLSDRQGNAT